MTDEQLATTPQPSAPARPDALERVLFGLAVLALLLAPTQLTLPLPGLPLHPAEPVLLLGALVWAIRWLRVRDSHCLPPLTHWLMIGAVAMGVFAASDALQLSVLKEAAQSFLYLGLAYPMFRATLTSPHRLRIAAVALLITTTLALLLATEQRVYLQRYLQPDPAQRQVFKKPTHYAYLVAQLPQQVCSTFSGWSEHGYHPSRGAYAGFLALVLPFGLALLVSSRKRPGMLIWASVIFALAAITVLAGYLVPAILLGLLVTGFAVNARAGVQTLIGVACYLVLTAAVGGINRTEVLREPFDLRVNAVEARYRYEDGTRHLKKFWGEHLAALNMVRSSPLLGTGAGKYGSQVGQSYDVLGAVDEQRSEPGLQNGYLLTAASSGLLGLTALLLLFGNYLGLARQAVRADRSPWIAAAAGALAALLALTLATNPWVRGLSVVIIAVMAAIGHAATRAPEARIKEREDGTCD